MNINPIIEWWSIQESLQQPLLFQKGSSGLAWWKMFSLLELKLQKGFQQQGIYPALHMVNYLSSTQCPDKEFQIQCLTRIWKSTTTARLQNHIFKEDNWMCEPLCELLASSVALIIFPLKYTNTKYTFWWSKPRYGSETFWILFLL